MNTNRTLWDKVHIGTGYWTRNRHELLLIGTRGDIPAPAPGQQPESVIAAPVGAHSAKPLLFAELIERLYPTVPKIELFCRGEGRPNWSVWGNEAEPARPTPAPCASSPPARASADDDIAIPGGFLRRQGNPS